MHRCCDVVHGVSDVHTRTVVRYIQSHTPCNSRSGPRYQIEGDDGSFLLQIFFFMAAHFVYIGSFVRFGTAPRPEGLSKLDLAGRIAIATILVIALVALCDNMLPALESKFRLAVSLSSQILLNIGLIKKH